VDPSPVVRAAETATAQRSSRIPLSVIVLTRNEELNIAACLGSLMRFDQVLVLDSHSTDQTAAIAGQWGATVLPFCWDGQYPKKKQWALDHLPLQYRWVMFVDADERITPELADELALLMQHPPSVAAFWCDSRPVVLGRTLRFGARYRKIVLLDRMRVRFPPCPDLDVSTMWEVEGHYQPQVDGLTGHLRQVLLHDDRKGPVAWIARHNIYSDWEARLTLSQRDQLTASEGWWRSWLKSNFIRLPARPLLVFLHDYVWRLGLLDGRAGLHMAVARAVYYWMIAWKRDWLNKSR
jgi:glycosyltransferase involved in cell wall biosynthesis